MLNPGAKRSNLTVRWNKRSRAFVVDNLFRCLNISLHNLFRTCRYILSKMSVSSIECAELDDLLAVLEEGLKNRAIGTHNMNEHSSRSHTILTVHIHRYPFHSFVFSFGRHLFAIGRHEDMNDFAPSLPSTYIHVIRNEIQLLFICAHCLNIVHSSDFDQFSLTNLQRRESVK